MEERIIEVSEKMFLQFGIRNITMDDIAKELGISKKTIYQFFDDKDALVDKVTEFIFQKKLNEAEVMHLRSKNAIDEILMATQAIKDVFLTINPVFFYDLQKHHPNSWLKYQDFRNHNNQLIKRNLIDGIEQGYYRPDLNVDIIAKMRIECIKLGFDTEVFPLNTYNLIEIQLENLKHFLRGIVTPIGLELVEKSII